MRTIVIATNNAFKIKEFKRFLRGFKVLSLKDIGYSQDIVEDGKTFGENALIKAKTVSEYLASLGKDYIVFADDSGLCVDALGGEPGIKSARFAGDHDDEANRQKLLKLLDGKTNRKAHYETAVVAYLPNGDFVCEEGKSEGEITTEIVGDAKTSFAYDCLFFSTELGKCFSECTIQEKNTVSHRIRAIKKVIAELKNISNKSKVGLW